MNIRKQITGLTRSYNRNNTYFEKEQAQSFKSDTILFNGGLVKRKRIVFQTVGCALKTCTMCPFPNESLKGVTGDNLINQFTNSFVSDSINNYDMITMFCNGNWFNDKEISQEALNTIFKLIADSADSNVRYIVVESLPQYITKEKLEKVQKLIGGKTLVVFMGLQSINDDIRNLAINTTCTLHAFNKACTDLMDLNWIPVPFLMVKPPFVTGKETIEDCVKSLKYLASKNVKHVTLCPMRVASNTLAEEIYKGGLYKPDNIWTVVDILKQAHDISGITVMVNTTELKPDKNETSVCMTSCPKCDIVGHIEKYLYSRDILELDISCDCYGPYLNSLELEIDTKTIKERIEEFLNEKSISPL